MTVALSLSIVFAVIALIGFILIVIAAFRQRKYDGIRTTPAVTIGSLSSAPQGGATCEINGIAEPGPAGQLVGPMSGRPCVWFHAWVAEHWTTTTATYNGTSVIVITNHHERVLHETGSPPQISLRDHTGVALLDFGPVKVDRPFPSFRNRVPARAVPGLRYGRQNHHVTYSEDIVPPGQPIFALGRGGPHPQTGVPALVRPASGPFIVSTRSEEQFTEGTRTMMLFLYIVGGLLGATGLSGAVWCLYLGLSG